VLPDLGIDKLLRIARGDPQLAALADTGTLYRDIFDMFRGQLARWQIRTLPSPILSVGH
jgi:hypothetical protein